MRSMPVKGDAAGAPWRSRSAWPGAGGSCYNNPFNYTTIYILLYKCARIRPRVADMDRALANTPVCVEMAGRKIVGRVIANLVNDMAPGDGQ